MKRGTYGRMPQDRLPRAMSRRTKASLSWTLVALVGLFCACSTPTPLQPTSAAATAPVDAQPQQTAAAVPQTQATTGVVIGRSERVLVYVPSDGDSFDSLAQQFLGSAAQAWQLAQNNPGLRQPLAGQPLVVPLVQRNPLGVTPQGVQSVPILCYHRMAAGPSKMAVLPASFEAQMQWLADNGYQVVRLSDLAAFLAGHKALPPRSVVITFDDGYETVYRHAFAVLKKHSAPATLFVYSDFLGSPDALTWPQMEEMWGSGLVDIQAHSKTHSRLTERSAGESDAVYRGRLETELKQPRAVIERRLSAKGLKVRHFAYPFGDANESVMEAMRRQDYEIGVTVVPGSNPFYSAPLLLKRIMIYGEHSLEDFKARLNGGRAVD